MDKRNIAIAVSPLLCCGIVMGFTLLFASWLDLDVRANALRKMVEAESSKMTDESKLLRQAWETSGVVTWGSTAIFVAVAFSLSLAVAIWAIVQSQGGWAWVGVLVGSGALTCFAVLWMTPASARNNEIELLNTVDYFTTVGNPVFGASIVWTGITLMRWSFWPPSSPESLRHKLRVLDVLLFATALLLVAGTAEIAALFRWQFSIPLPSDVTLSEHAAVAKGIGLICSLLAFSVFAPAVSRVFQDAKILALRYFEEERGKNPTPKEVDRWLEENGIHLGVRYQALRGMVAASPVLSALAGIA